MTDRDFVIEEVSDPDEIRRSRAQDDVTAVTVRGCRRTGDVSAGPWQVCRCRGQEAFIAETPAEAWAWVEATPGG